MKAKWNETSVFVTMVSSDCSYAIVTKNKDKVSGQFKVDLVNLTGLNTNDILKLQKFKYDDNVCEGKPSER
jgi:hypothetical protein